MVPRAGVYNPHGVGILARKWGQIGGAFCSQRPATRRTMGAIFPRLHRAGSVIALGRLHQRPLNLHLPAQQHHFGVAPCKSASESCNHFSPSNKMGVEGCVSICKIAAGSGAGLGLRAIGGGSALGVAAQPLSAIKISAALGSARGLRRGVGIGVVLRLCGVGGLGGGGLLLLLQRGLGAGGVGFCRVGDQVAVCNLLGVQAPGLQGQQRGEDGGADGGGAGGACQKLCV